MPKPPAVHGPPAIDGDHGNDMPPPAGGRGYGKGMGKAPHKAKVGKPKMVKAMPVVPLHKAKAPHKAPVNHAQVMKAVLVVAPHKAKVHKAKAPHQAKAPHKADGVGMAAPHNANGMAVAMLHQLLHMMPPPRVPKNVSPPQRLMLPSGCMDDPVGEPKSVVLPHMSKALMLPPAKSLVPPLRLHKPNATATATDVALSEPRDLKRARTI